MIYKARVPTNIAFLKYWGKSDEQSQWPANDSLSMTLDLYTETWASAERGRFPFASTDSIEDTDPFFHKALRHLKFLAKHLNFQEPISIQTHNEFPAGCGLASSASGLASLTLAAIACWTRSSSFEELEKNGFSRERLASLSRLGSGSACRSLWGGFVYWQKGANISSQTVAPLFPKEHWALRDCVVILSDVEKSVSSTEGHRYASSSPLFQTRLQHLPQRLEAMKEAIAKRDLPQLGNLLEEEALEMHEVMATSTPPCVYMTGSTFNFLSFLAQSRAELGIPMYFTLDAGPNVHVIYQEDDKDKVQDLFKEYKTIDVAIGAGPSISELAHD